MTWATTCAWAVTALAGVLIDAHAASFDCRQARTPQERFICANEDVSRLDREMGERYRLHVSGLSEPARRRVLASQRAWLAFWPRSCSKSTRQIVLDQDSVECVHGLYSRRLADLQPLAPGAGLLAYAVSQYRYLAPSDRDAPARVHQSTYPQVDVVPGRQAPPWLGAFNAWLDRSRVYEPDKLLDADSTSEVSLTVSHTGREVVQAVEAVDFHGHGAAHGLMSLAYRHFLIAQARPLQAEDLFTGPQWRQALAQKVLEALREELGEDLLVSDVKELVELIGTSRWDLAGPGLQLHFNPYEVAPYARGFVTVEVAASELGAHLTDLGRRLLVAPAQVSPATGRRAEVFQDCDDCPEMVVVPPGRFAMGSADLEPGRKAHEGPQRVLDVAAFAIGRFEVTQRQWQAVMGGNPSGFADCGPQCPVDNVDWDEAQEFVRRLSQRTGQSYGLPTEAQWEYAARAGSTSAYSWGEHMGPLDANCDGCDPRWGGSRTAPVGSFRANAFGLHDMHGNVWEWVQDTWHDSYAGAPTDASAWVEGGDASRKVVRGGSWLYKPQDLRSASRDGSSRANRDDNTGFRVVRALAP